MTSISADTIINSDNIAFSSSVFQNDTNQDDYLITDTFTSTSYLNTLNIDQNDVADTTSVQSTYAIASNTLTLTYGSSSGYNFTGVSNRYMHGRNKFISVNLTSGSSNTPIIMTRYTSTSDFVLSYFNSGSSSLNFQTYSGSGSTTVDRYSIPSYSTSTNYRLVLKIFENLVSFSVIDPTTLKLMRNQTVYNSVALGKTGTRNGFGSTGGTVGFSNLKTKDMQNFINVICIGDSNTDDGPSLPHNTVGGNYVQILNNKYLEKNINFTNLGVSGDDTYDILNRISGIISCYVSGARNIATILIGTNDASNVHNTWNFATSCSNISSIASKLKNAGFEVWFCTYPPRNQNPAVGSLGGLSSQSTMNTQNLRLSQLNGFIRSLSTSQNVDRIIPLDYLFMDPTAAVAGVAPIVYQNSSSTLVDQANNTVGYIHFIGAGHAIIASEIEIFIEKSWSQNNPKQNLNITNGINIYGKNNLFIPSAVNSNVAVGALNVNGCIALTNSTNNYANTIMWTAGNNAEPNGPNTARSIGGKLILWSNLSSSGTDYAIGIGSNSMWYQVDVNAFHNWYCGGTKVANLDTTSFTINNTTAVPSTSATPSGALNVAGAIALTGGSGQSVIMMAGGNYGTPSATSRSPGSRLIMNPSILGATSYDYAIGIHNSPVQMWFSCNTLTDHYIFYHSGTNTLDITNASTTFGNNNIVSHTNTTASTSNSVASVLLSGGLSSSNTTNSVSATNGGTFTTAGGAGIAKDLYVGGITTVTNTTAATTATSGSLSTRGGISTGANSYFTPNIGIGINPTFPLHISATSSGSIAGAFGFLAASGAGTSSASGSVSVSINCNGRIFSGEVDVASDSRIKTNISTLDLEKSHSQLMSIIPRTFNYIDSYSHGQEKTIGFVAQELKEKIPKVVSVITSFIPNIMKKCNLVDKNTIEILDFSESILNKTVKFIEYTNQGKTEMTLIGTVCKQMGNVITVDVVFEENSVVFVYGTQVDDFHKVNYSAIIPILVSGYQNQMLKIEKIEKELNKLI
jgi:hypothetical protein